MDKLVKFIKINSWEIVIAIGCMILFVVGVLYSVMGFNEKTSFWQSILPSIFVDVISILVTTFLVSKLIELKWNYKEKEEFYRIIKMKHIKVIYQLEYDYVNSITLGDKEENIKDVYLSNIINYINQQDKLFLNQKIINGDQNSTKEMLFYQMKEESLKRLEKYLITYSSLMPLDYKKMLVELQIALEELHASSIAVKLSGVENLANDHKEFVSILREMVDYFKDIDKGKAAFKKGKNYGWGIITFVSVVYIICMWFLYFCMHLYGM